MKTVIFDLDGTLLNTLEDLYCSTNFALQECGFPPRRRDEVKNFVGNGVNKLIERAIPNGTENPKFGKCLNIFKTHYSKNMYNSTKPYEGIIEMLEDLHKLNCKIAVVSNKFDSAVKKLCNKYFSGLIDIAAGENEKCGIKKKPSPDTINLVLKSLNQTSDNALYVGDSEVDIECAANGNLPCISVCWGFKSEEFLIKNGAKILAHKPSDVVQIIKEGKI